MSSPEAHLRRRWTSALIAVRLWLWSRAGRQRQPAPFDAAALREASAELLGASLFSRLNGSCWLSGPPLVPLKPLRCMQSGKLHVE